MDCGREKEEVTFRTPEENIGLKMKPEEIKVENISMRGKGGCVPLRKLGGIMHLESRVLELLSFC